MALTTLARIRALGGFRAKRTLGDTLGTGNGSNLVFAPRQMAVFVSPTDDVPSVDEIVVYVNGVSVEISSISESVVILAAAPPDGSTVTADYYGHSVANVEIELARSGVEAEIFGRFNGMYTPESLATSPLISRIVAYLAAADLGDQAYNEMGSNTPGAVFPPDRLRRVAYNLLDQIVAGVIDLVDASGSEIPIVAEIDAWISETTYGDKDRLFENDPFYANASGVLASYEDREPYRW